MQPGIGKTSHLNEIAIEDRTGTISDEELREFSAELKDIIARSDHADSDKAKCAVAPPTNLSELKAMLYPNLHRILEIPEEEMDRLRDEFLLMQERDWYGLPWNNDITNYSMVSTRKEAANQIAEGYLNGPGWELELDIGKIIKEDGVDAAVSVVKNIAGFIEDGLDSGISPPWRFVLEK